MSTYTYSTELSRIKDPDLAAELDRLIRLDPRIPTGPLGAWALAYARWRRGDRDSYPAPPSSARGVTVENILRIDSIVREVIEWRPRRGAPDEIDVDDLSLNRRRIADWNPTA